MCICIRAVTATTRCPHCDRFGICVAAIQEQVGDACLWEGQVRARGDNYPGFKIGNCVSLSAAMDKIERELCQHWPELAQP